MSLTLLIKYRQRDYILALAKRYHISATDLTKLELLITNSSKVGEDEVNAIIQQYSEFNIKYQALLVKASLLKKYDIKTTDSFTNHIQNNVEQPHLQKIVVNELTQYQESIENYFSSDEATFEELKQNLNPFFFLYPCYKINNPNQFNELTKKAEVDLTGDLNQRKLEYNEKYEAYTHSKDFHSLRELYIWLYDTYELCSFNEEFQKYCYLYTPENIIQQLCKNYGLILDEQYIRQLEEYRLLFEAEYRRVYQNAKNKIYSLYQSKLLESLNELIIKFNEFSCEQRGGSPSYNGFTFISQNNSPQLKEEYLSEIEPKVQFAFDPSPERKNIFAKKSTDILNKQNFSTLFLTKDCIRDIGNATKLYDNNQQIININKTINSTDINGIADLSLDALSKMHNDQRIQRTISHIANQLSLSIINRKIQQIIHHNGQFISPVFNRIVTIRVLDNKIIFNEKRIYYRTNPSLHLSQMPRIYTHLEYEIPFTEDPLYVPSIQNFCFKIATTKEDPRYQLQVTPFICGNKQKEIEHIDMLFPYLKEFMRYLNVNSRSAGKTFADIQAMNGICDLFTLSKYSYDTDAVDIKNQILQVYQGQSNWLDLSNYLLTLARGKLNSHSAKSGPNYNILLRIARHLSLTVISHKLANIQIKLNEQWQENYNNVFSLFKLLALLSNNDLSLNLDKFNIIFEKAEHLVCLFKQQPEFLGRFFQQYKNDITFPAIISGIITLSHQQIQQNNNNKLLFKKLKLIGTDLLFKALENANQNLPNDPSTLTKSNFKKAANLNYYALHLINITSNKISQNCKAQRKHLDKKLAIYYKFAKNHLKLDCPASEQEKNSEIISEIIASDKSKWFLREAASNHQNEISKSRLLNILKSNARKISLATLNYLNQLKVFNLRSVKPQKKSSSNLSIVVSNEKPRISEKTNHIEPIENSGELIFKIDKPTVAENELDKNASDETYQSFIAKHAQHLTSKYIDQLKTIDAKLLNKGLSSLNNKEQYNALIDDLLKNNIANSEEAINQLNKLYQELPITSPLKKILAKVYIPAFLLSQKKDFQDESKKIQFDQFFKDFELLRHALFHTLKIPELESESIATEFLDFILDKIKQPETRKYFITRSFLNELTDKELVRLAILDKSGEVAKTILNTGFWDKWLRNHPSKKLDHLDITRIIMAHTDKEPIIERAFAAKSFFSGRDFSQEFLPEDLSCIYTYCDKDLMKNTYVNNNPHLRTKLMRGIDMQNTWLEMIFDAPLFYIKELIELTRLNNDYLAGLVNKHSALWHKFIPNLAQEIEPDTVRNHLLTKLTSISLYLCHNADKIDNQNYLMEIFSDPLKKSFFGEYILPSLNRGVFSDAIARTQSNLVAKQNLFEFFNQNEDLKQLLTENDNALFTQIERDNSSVQSCSPFISHRTSHSINADIASIMGHSLSSIWTNTFSRRQQIDEPCIGQDIIAASSINPNL